MSRSFRKNYPKCARPLRGFYAGKYRQGKKKRRYALKALLDEDGTPLNPQEGCHTWSFGKSRIYWVRKAKVSFHFRRPGRKVMRWTWE